MIRLFIAAAIGFVAGYMVKDLNDFLGRFS